MMQPIKTQWCLMYAHNLCRVGQPSSLLVYLCKRKKASLKMSICGVITNNKEWAAHNTFWVASLHIFATRISIFNAQQGKNGALYKCYSGRGLLFSEYFRASNGHRRPFSPGIFGLIAIFYEPVSIPNGHRRPFS